jgi:hypothetical protein
MINNHQTINCQWLNIDILSIFVLVLGLIFFCSCISVNAQLIHITTSVPDSKIGDSAVIVDSKLFPTSHEPPNVELLTKELIQGKNVIKVSITSESGINNCKISYLKQGTMKTVDCVNDHDTVYKALIDADPPSQTIQIYARDIYGDSTDSIERLNVVPQPSIIDLIWNSLSHLL